MCTSHKSYLSPPWLCLCTCDLMHGRPYTFCFNCLPTFTLHTYEPKQILAAKLFSFQIVSAQEPSEVTLKGNEYLSYNLFEKSGEPILSKHDEVSLYFRTNRPEGLLFYTGTYLCKHSSLNARIRSLVSQMVWSIDFVGLNTLLKQFLIDNVHVQFGVCQARIG